MISFPPIKSISSFEYEVKSNEPDSANSYDHKGEKIETQVRASIVCPSSNKITLFVLTQRDLLTKIAPFLTVRDLEDCIETCQAWRIVRKPYRKITYARFYFDLERKFLVFQELDNRYKSFGNNPSECENSRKELKKEALSLLCEFSEKKDLGAAGHPLYFDFRKLLDELCTLLIKRKNYPLALISSFFYVIFEKNSSIDYIGRTLQKILYKLERNQQRAFIHEMIELFKSNKVSQFYGRDTLIADLFIQLFRYQQNQETRDDFYDHDLAFIQDNLHLTKGRLNYWLSQHFAFEKKFEKANQIANLVGEKGLSNHLQDIEYAYKCGWTKEKILKNYDGSLKLNSAVLKLKREQEILKSFPTSNKIPLFFLIHHKFSTLIASFLTARDSEAGTLTCQAWNKIGNNYRKITHIPLYLEVEKTKLIFQQLHQEFNQVISITCCEGNQFNRNIYLMREEKIQLIKRRLMLEGYALLNLFSFKKIEPNISFYTFLDKLCNRLISYEEYDLSFSLSAFFHAFEDGKCFRGDINGKILQFLRDLFNKMDLKQKRNFIIENLNKLRGDSKTLSLEAQELIPCLFANLLGLTDYVKGDIDPHDVDYLIEFVPLILNSSTQDNQKVAKWLVNIVSMRLALFKKYQMATKVAHLQDPSEKENLLELIQDIELAYKYGWTLKKIGSFLDKNKNQFKKLHVILSLKTRDRKFLS